MVFQLIYTSSAKTELDNAQLAEIAETSRKNNEALDITGVMLVHDGSILQVLEGDEFVIEALYKKISYDSRHGQLQVLTRRHTKIREFSNWRMGFKQVNPNTDDEIMFKLTRDALSKIITDKNSSEVQSMGNSFARVAVL